jgi:hypothetical protein
MEDAKLIVVEYSGEGPPAGGRIRAANGPREAGSGTALPATETPAQRRYRLSWQLSAFLL